MKSEEFIREVDEELQREKLATLWKLYGHYVIGAAVLIVAGTAGIVGWDAWRASQLEAQGAALDKAEQAIAAGRYKDAAADLAELSADHGGGPSAVAELRRAFALQQDGDTPGAIAALDDLAARSDIDPILTDLGKLQSLALQIDTADTSMLSRELEPLAAADRAWHHSARELQVALALRAGETERAKEILQQLTEDATTPQGIRGRASSLLDALGGTKGAGATAAGDGAKGG